MMKHMRMDSQPIPATVLPKPATDKVFCTTQWTRVSRAKSDSPEGRRALEELCTAYYEPVATFLRYTLRDTDAARDLAHEFFEHMLAGGAIAHAEKERGRFRSYLLGAVKHFLAHHREAARRLKRGGGVESISLNDSEVGADNWLADESRLSPDAAYDRKWALNVIARSLDALRQECIAEGRADFFEHVKPWLTGEASHGDQAALAPLCGMNANALKVAVHRLKQRFRHVLKAEVAGTLDDPSQVDAEMRVLFAALES
jgi:DNA-directed RNA polymerase specialized sigma24 family protein